MKKLRRKKGFTLIEMVAVVAIIGILAAILIPKVTGYMNEAKKTKIVDQARKVTQAIESAKMKKPALATSGASGQLDTISDPIIIELLGETPGASVTVGSLTGTGNLLPNLKSTMTAADCEHIATGGDFTLSGEDFGATR